MAKARQRYGDPFSMTTINGRVVVTAEPELIREIFTTKDTDRFEPFASEAMTPFFGRQSLLLLQGDPHRRERKLLTPPFHGERMRAYGETIATVARRIADAQPRGQTFAALEYALLRDTIEASWSLLAPWEQDALCQVSVFRGGFTVGAAESTLELQAGAPSVLDVLQSLRDKSLLQAELSAGSRRFTLLASIREFSEDKLDERRRAEVYARHARTFLQLGEALAARLEVEDDVDVRRRLRLEHENFFAVHRRFLAGLRTNTAPAQHDELRGASLRAALILSKSAGALPYAALIEVLSRALAAPPDDQVDTLTEARALEARGNLLPEHKLDAIKTMQREIGPTAMTGDGINDAPALAQADIGVAMGAAGTDTAMEAADVVVMNDDLRRIAETVRLSRRTHAVLWQNIALALGIKAAFLVLALFDNASMWMAVFADMGASLLVVFNGLRLLRPERREL